MSGSKDHPASIDIQVSEFTLPTSKLLSPETRCVLAEQNNIQVSAQIDDKKNTLTPEDDTSRKFITKSEKTQREREMFYRSPDYQSMKKRYAVDVELVMMAGVYTEHFVPKEGVSPDNESRVLINLHGGSFLTGSRTISHLESIPIAAVAKIKVISVDYRLAPEHQFPAATDDTLAVYRELLNHYSADNIGIFGCSAGARLTAHAIARIQHEGLPMPAAVSMACAATGVWDEGDSWHWVNALSDYPLPPRESISYFQEKDFANPMAFPSLSDELMAAFPPSLLVSATRDYSLSPVVSAHAQFVKLGVDTELHIWDGLEHVFLYNPDFSESRDCYQIVARFFDTHLNR